MIKKKISNLCPIPITELIIESKLMVSNKAFKQKWRIEIKRVRQEGVRRRRRE